MCIGEGGGGGEVVTNIQKIERKKGGKEGDGMRVSPHYVGGVD